MLDLYTSLLECIINLTLALQYLAESFESSCDPNDIRLTGNGVTSSLEGTVEICVNGDWGTINHDFWDYRDASVACRQLGFSPLGTIRRYSQQSPKRKSVIIHTYVCRSSMVAN